MISRQAYERFKMVGHHAQCKTTLSAMLVELTMVFSCNELHRDGVQGMRNLPLTLHHFHQVIESPLTELRQVREATNNEPWGASSTMMQEIANATFN